MRFFQYGVQSRYSSNFVPALIWSKYSPLSGSIKFGILSFRLFCSKALTVTLRLRIAVVQHAVEQAAGRFLADAADVGIPSAEIPFGIARGM